MATQRQKKCSGLERFAQQMQAIEKAICFRKKEEPINYLTCSCEKCLDASNPLNWLPGYPRY
jgi:hypothetical protein